LHVLAASSGKLAAVTAFLLALQGSYNAPEKPVTLRRRGKSSSNNSNLLWKFPIKKIKSKFFTDAQLCFLICM